MRHTNNSNSARLVVDSSITCRVSAPGDDTDEDGKENLKFDEINATNTTCVRAVEDVIRVPVVKTGRFYVLRHSYRTILCHYEPDSR